MRPKSMVLIVIALGCGLVASIGISQVLESRNQLEEKVETVEVLVAKGEIKVAESIKEEMLELEMWPKDKVPSGAFRKFEDIEGRKPKQQIFAGETIIPEKIFGEGELNKHAAMIIRPGYRAVTVKVSDAVAVANLLKPGDTVDVLVYLRRGEEVKQTVMKTILENVRVFAVNDHLDRIQDENGKSIKAKTVTLEVKPAEVELLTLADSIGRIRLSARRADDMVTRSTSGQGVGALFDDLNDDTPNLPDWIRTKDLDRSVSVEVPSQPVVTEISEEYMDILVPTGIHRWEIPEDGSPPRQVSEGWDDGALEFAEGGKTEGSGDGTGEPKLD